MIVRKEKQSIWLCQGWRIYQIFADQPQSQCHSVIPSDLHIVAFYFILQLQVDLSSVLLLECGRKSREAGKACTPAGYQGVHSLEKTYNPQKAGLLFIITTASSSKQC